MSTLDVRLAADRRSRNEAGPFLLRLPQLRFRITSIYLGLFFSLSFASRLAFEVGGFRVRPEYVLLVMGLIWLLLRGRVPNPSIIPGAPLLFGWLFLNVISTFAYAPVLRESLKSLALLFAGGLTLLLISYLGRTERQDPIRIYLDVWFLSIFVGVAGTAADLVLGTHLVTGIITDVVTYRYTQGLFWEWNFYGIASMMLGIILLDDWVRAMAVTNRISIPYRLLICGVAVLLSATRSAQVTFALGIAFILIVRYRRRRIWLPRIIVTAGLAAAVLALFLSGLVHTTYTDRLIGSILSPGSSDSFVGRLSMISRATNQMTGRWWLGHGTNTFGQINPTLDPNGVAIYGTAGTYLSNLPVSVLYDTGILGSILVVGWLVVHHLRCFRASLPGTADSRLWPLAFSSVLMFVTFITTNGLLISFAWVHLAMTIVAVRRGSVVGSDAQRQSLP